MAGDLSPDDLKAVDLLIELGIPIGTFLLGFFVSRFTMTKKERKDYEIQLVETARQLIGEQTDAFQEFSKAINKYANKKGEPNLDDFFLISTTGEVYFSRIRASCDAIIAGKVDKDSLKNTIFPKVKDAVERSLPDFYKTLKEIAEREGITYSGELKRENYESIYKVYGKYA
ncbi:hypothetical protein [Salinicola sp. CR57]|uniref:hypothetical protein n=1 Tax=Salinicola sp. CR57 TaxID=1949086 RepID=UPI001300A4E0|nr:hypothetical protein [Salinicola sp. CR57]